MTRPDISHMFTDTDHAADLRGERPTYAEVLAQIARDDEALNALYAARAYRRRERRRRTHYAEMDRICIVVGLFALTWFVGRLLWEMVK